jgi:hypothetical protein
MRMIKRRFMLVALLIPFSCSTFFAEHVKPCDSDKVLEINMRSPSDLAEQYARLSVGRVLSTKDQLSKQTVIQDFCRSS